MISVQILAAVLSVIAGGILPLLKQSVRELRKNNIIIDVLPHDERPKIEAQYPEFISRHVGRAATVLLCLITEIQTRFRFEGADINGRIVTMWNALMEFFEAKELYNDRYESLMRATRILA